VEKKVIKIENKEEIFKQTIKEDEEFSSTKKKKNNYIKSPKFDNHLNDSLNLRLSSNTVNGMMNKTKLYIKKENIIFEETRKSYVRNK